MILNFCAHCGVLYVPEITRESHCENCGMHFASGEDYAEGAFSDTDGDKLLNAATGSPLRSLKDD